MRRRSTARGAAFILACGVGTYYCFVGMVGPTEGLRIFLLLCLVAVPMGLIWVVLNLSQPRRIEVKGTGLLLALRDRQELIPWDELIIEERVFWHVFPAVHIALRDGEAWVFKDYIGFDVIKSLCTPPEDCAAQKMNPPISDGSTTAEDEDSGGSEE